MKCIIHKEDAIGVCKACGRAVCEKCTDLSSDIIACAKSCQKRATEIQNFETWAISESKKSPERWKNQASTYRSTGRTYLAKSCLWLFAAIVCGYVLIASEAEGVIKAAAFLGFVFTSVFVGTCIVEYRRWVRLAKEVE